MNKQLTIVSLVLVLAALPAWPGIGYAQQQAPAPSQKAAVSMMVTGTIARGSSGYIIRGETPAEIFNILNPDPTQLNPYVASGKTVRLSVKSTLGDNVVIEAINGQGYKDSAAK